jgi:hypothetical protein
MINYPHTVDYATTVTDNRKKSSVKILMLMSMKIDVSAIIIILHQKIDKDGSY